MKLNVKDTVAKFRRKDPALTKLQIDDFRYPDIDLEGEEHFDGPTICHLLKEAEQSPHIKTLELRFVEVSTVVASALVRLLTSKVPSSQDNQMAPSTRLYESEQGMSGAHPELVDREWEAVSIIGCTGLGAQNSELFITLSIGLSKCRRLLLNHNGITYHGLVSMGMLLRFSTSLRSLHIKREHLKGEDARAFFEGLQENKSIEELVLNFCRFDEDGVEAFATAIERNTTIRVLDLGACYLPDHHIERILDALSTHPLLEDLVLTLNACHALGTLALSNLLTSGGSKLVSLNLSHQKVDTLMEGALSQHTGKVDMRCLSGALRNNTSLRSLKLNRNRLHLGDLQPLIEALTTENKTLRILDLNNNAFEDEAFQKIAIALPFMQGLHKLYLLNNDIQHAATSQFLLDGMEDNFTLRVLQIKTTIPLYPEIQRYAALNRGGRHLLSTEEELPLELWSHILARANTIPWGTEYPSICVDNHTNFSNDLLFFLLQGPVLLHN